MQSGVGKLSCNKTALKRCTSTETLWNRKAPSLSLPEDEEIFLPKLPKSWHADVFKGPKVSMLAYFSFLREAASSAAAPASRADPVTNQQPVIVSIVIINIMGRPKSSRGGRQKLIPVSYTHLTLPTIYSV